MGEALEHSKEHGATVVTLGTASHQQKVIGRASPSAPDSVEEFRGIPYGTVPGRWKHSTLRNCLPDDEFDATRNGPQCPQPTMFANSQTYQSYLAWPNDVVDNEFDCLNLFIIRPSPAALERIGLHPGKTKLPVYFMMHGGGFGFGAGTDPIWDPTRLVLRAIEQRNPFIAVNINYRLGIFGFGFSSDIMAMQQADAAITGGNFGLGDQRIALRWVAQNIPAFGGDPKRITIAGQSAGGISVHSHVLEAKFGGQPPLFRRAVQQSGGNGVLGPTYLEELDRRWARFYDSVSISGKPGRERINHLLAMSPSDLLSTAMKLGWITYDVANDGLTVRDRGSGGWSFHLGRMERQAPEDPEGPRQPICLLIGDCEDEGLYGHKIAKIADFKQLKDICSSATPAIYQPEIEEILSLYNITSETRDGLLRQRLSRLLTDYQFGLSLASARAELRSDANGCSGPSHVPKPYPTSVRPFRVKAGNPFPGENQHVAHHCVELLYVYDCFHIDMAEIDRAEEGPHPRDSSWASNASLVSLMQEQWIDFICDDTVSGQDNVAVVYEVNRKVYHRNTEEDEEWVAMEARLSELKKHSESVKSLEAAIRHLS